MNQRHAILLVLIVAWLQTGCGGTYPHMLYDFREDGLATGVHVVGTAIVHQSSGRLYVETNGAGAGVFLEIPPEYDCVALEDVIIPDQPALGASITFTWFARAADGTVYPLLTSEWVETNSTKYKTSKKNKQGDTVQRVIVVSRKTVSKYSPFRIAFDRRMLNGVEQIQLEFRDPRNNKIKKLLPWVDPEATTTVGVQITTDLPHFSVGGISVSPVHQDSNLPEFAASEFWSVPSM